MRGVIIMILVLFLASCSEEICRETSASQVEVEIKIDRIEKELFSADSKAEILTILESHKSFSDLFLQAAEYPSYSVLADKIYALTKDAFIDTVYNEVAAEFDDLTELEETLEDGIGRMKSLFPDMKTPKIQTTITGLYNDLYISDTLVIVGLDYFIGDNASYPPVNIPQYILDRYDKAHLPSTIIKFLSGPYILKGKKETLLSEMIDFGKSFYLISQLLPCVPDSIIMGYSPKSMKIVEDNQAVIWANFIENEVLYDTNHLTKRKFLGERPNVYEISQECPGRIGAWIGWQVVKSYMENNRIDLKEMIIDTDNDKIFRLSGYKPKG